VSARPALLVIAGHDPSSGPRGYAGVRADEEGVQDGARAAGVADVELRTVVTAWTDQDDRAVRSLGARPASEWLAEARTAATGLAAVKIGLLPGKEHVLAVAEFIRELRSDAPELPIVLDPILASSSGEEFLGAEAWTLLLSEVLPQGIVLTPNLPEARILSGGALAPDPDSSACRLRYAEVLLARGARAVVLKGGHGGEDPLLNLVLGRRAEVTWLRLARERGSMRGTGCRFASTLAVCLGLGFSLQEAARVAGECVLQRMAKRKSGGLVEG
jgi:hydroxymethylpyrimidine/phosphomethylpyrimidine kinase